MTITVQYGSLIHWGVYNVLRQEMQRLAAKAEAETRGEAHELEVTDPHAAWSDQAGDRRQRPQVVLRGDRENQER